MALYCTTTRQKVPLTAVLVSASIRGSLADVTTTLEYENTSDLPAESVFVFPMSDACAVYHMDVAIDGRVIVAECQEKEQARETYREAKESGFAAFLVEEDDSSRDIFQCSVGNLPPRSKASVHLSFIMELMQELDGRVRFTLPQALKPRYTPAPTRTGNADPRIDLSSSGPSLDNNFHTQTSTNYTFAFDATIVHEQPIKDVSSSTCHIQWTADPASNTRGEVQLTETCHSKDVSFDILYEATDKPYIMLERGIGQKGGFLAKDLLLFGITPHFSDNAGESEHKHEFIFVIDRSGSMSGGYIQSAGEALLLFLKSLPVGSYFNIVGFGSSFQALFDSSVLYNEENMLKAMQYQQNLDSSMGGTEILKPLKHIMNQSNKPGFSREVFVLTDGSVSNTREVIAFVRSAAHSTRVFAVGIGQGASTSLVQGLADAGHGSAEFVINKEDRVQAKVIKLLTSSLHGVLRDVTMSVQTASQTLPVHTLPHLLPCGHHGVQYTVYAIAESLPDGEMLTVTLSGQVGNDDYKESASVDFSDVPPGSCTLPLHRAAAKAEIRHLEFQLTDDPPAEDEASVKMLSTSANLISRFTSYVAVDTESHAIINMPRLEIDRRREMMLYLSCDPGLQSCSLRDGSSQFSRKKSKRVLQLPSFNFGNKISHFFSSIWNSKPRRDQVQDRNASCSEGPTTIFTLLSVVTQQHLDGHWQLDELSPPWTDEQRQLVTAEEAHQDEHVWATAIILSCLQIYFPDQHSEWELVAHKAKQWMVKHDLKGASVDDLLQKATSMVTSFSP